MPRKVYKHMRREHAELLLSGAIRISALSYFHDIEGVPDGIADQLEGQTRSDLDGIYPGPGPNILFVGERPGDSFDFVGYGGAAAEMGGQHIKRAIGDAMGVDFSRANLHIAGGNTYIDRCPTAYILSLSFCGDLGMFGADYDAVVEVDNAEELTQAIVEAARPKISSATFDAVRYIRRTNHGAEGLLRADPFAKPLELDWQREGRAVFQPTGPIQPYLDVKSDRIAAACKRIA